MKKLTKGYIKQFPEFDEHEKVYKISDKDSGLLGFIAIHDTALGPAIGGTRILPYENEKEAVSDALRLSKSMTKKCAFADLSFGGGKAVIVGSTEDKTDDMLEGFAKEIDKLQGKFYTGEDIGINEDDVQKMLDISPYFIGKSDKAGDPSPYAAKSIFNSIQISAEEFLDKDSMEDVSVAIKGVGKVGSVLVDLLKKVGSDIYIADIDQDAVDDIKEKYSDIKVVEPSHIHNKKVDVYAPCALGNEFSHENKKEINAKIICGSANNQLEDKKIADWFFENEILYVPDYIANIGGAINVADELGKGGYKQERVESRVESIKDELRDMIKKSKKEKISPLRIADKIIRDKIKNYSAFLAF